VLLEDHASSSGTLSSLQHLSKDISFGDLFFSDKPLEADNDKTTVEIEVESTVSVTIQQDMSSIPPMTSRRRQGWTRPYAQAEGQTGSDTGTQDEGQAGLNPEEISEGQAIPSPVIHAGSDREHMDLDVADVLPQLSTKQLDEGFTATAYPKVQ
nr:hypothetical protein [Tanacetum cinerariifolium]